MEGLRENKMKKHEKNLKKGRKNACNFQLDAL